MSKHTGMISIISDRKKFRYILLILIPVIIIIMWQCSSPYTATGTRWNLSAIYNPASSQIHPSFRVYHNTDEQSLLLVKLFPNELLFSQANTSGEFLSRVSVQLQAYEIVDDKPVMVDSVTYPYTLKQENVGRRFLAQIPFKAEMGKRYQLRIVTRDLLRHDFNLRFVDVDKTSRFSDQNFKISSQNNTPFFNNVLAEGSIYKIEHRDKSYKTIFIDYYKNETPLPSPTFAKNIDERFYSKPDSTYIIDYTPGMYFAFSYEGLFHFRFDTTVTEGLTIVNFGRDFPKVKTPKELVEPLAYLTTSADYEKLLAAENKKLAVDNYWLGIAGSTGRARELIRIYYNRVYYTNYYFSGNKPGWKTDRGMVYIVYGPPQNMEKGPDSEKWLYYFKGASSSITFTFNYKPNAFNIDNYELQRSESHDWHWREAVDTWRSGEIFLLD